VAGAFDDLNEAARRYSPAAVIAVARDVVSGIPAEISTSYVERQNLSVRMSSRRFTRLTNAFSKKLENHAAAGSLYVAHYNLYRVHEARPLASRLSLGRLGSYWMRLLPLHQQTRPRPRQSGVSGFG
jgi:hypothetical protein